MSDRTGTRLSHRPTPSGSAGPVRVRTAPVDPAVGLAETVRSLTLAALEAPAGASSARAVVVTTRGSDVEVTLVEPLAGFARSHGCRSVAVHTHAHEGGRVATVVLTRHPSPA